MLYSYLLATVKHCDTEAGMHKVACCCGRRTRMQQLVSCQHNMEQLARAKPLAVFTWRDCLCRCMGKLLTSSVAHLKSTVRVECQANSHEVLRINLLLVRINFCKQFTCELKLYVHVTCQLV